MRKTRTKRARFSTEAAASDAALALNIRAEMEGWRARYYVKPVGRLGRSWCLKQSHRRVKAVAA